MRHPFLLLPVTLVLLVSVPSFALEIRAEERHNDTVYSRSLADEENLAPDGPLPLNDKPGDFTMYLDSRDSEESFYTGWLYLGEESFIICRIQTQTRERTLFILEYEWSAGMGQPQIKKLSPLEGPDDPEMTEVIQALLYDFFGVHHLRRRFVFSYGANAHPYYRSQEGQEVLPGSNRVLGFDFRYWIPVHQLYGIWDKALEESGLSLVGAGHVTDITDPEFYDFSLPDEVRRGPEYEIEAEESRVINLGGLAVPLDENWERDDSGMMIIAKETVRDAVVHTETVDLNALGVDLPTLIKYTLLYHGISVDPDSVRLDIINGYETLFFRIYDPLTRTETQSIDIFVPVQNSPGTYRVFNFNAFASFYNVNRDYFNRILF